MDLQSGKFYQVFDNDQLPNGLAARLKRYFERVEQCDAATSSFIKSLPKRCAFPDVSDAFAVMPADAEAGGLVGISLPHRPLCGDTIAATDADPSRPTSSQGQPSLADTTPDPYLWASIPDPDDADRIIYYPRVTISSHYIRYGVAVNLDATAAPDWKFHRNADGSIRFFRYDDVRMKIPTDDLARLHEQPRPNGTTRRLKSISPRMRLALGRRYDWGTDDPASQALILPPKSSPKFREARALFDLFQSLPIVPAHTLLRLLQLKSPVSPSQPSLSATPVPFLKWDTDTEAHRIIFHTNLVPDGYWQDELLPLDPDDPIIARLFAPSSPN